MALCARTSFSMLNKAFPRLFSTATLNDRIHKKDLLKKLCEPESLIPLFKNGMSLGWSGFTPVGYPKVMPVVLADYVEKNNLQGKLRFNLFAGASVGVETEDRWASLNMLKSRFPYQTGKNICKRINAGDMKFSDLHLSMFPQNLMYGFLTKKPLDFALVEATEILEDGSLILGGSVGSAPEFLDHAEHIIIELNTEIPSFKGLHDIYLPELPPFRKPINISHARERCGTESVKIDTKKIVGIVESRKKDNGRALGEPDDQSKLIAGHLIDFLENEVKQGRLPENLLPLQSGVGNIANAVMGGMADGPFNDLTVWTEVLQDTVLSLFDSGKLQCASATSLSLSSKGFDKFYAAWDKYAPNIILRPQQIANNPEMVRRLGTISMNTPIEVDIFGHANSSLVSGSKLVNGIGGSGDFLRNAFLSIMHTPSARKSASDPTGISCIVPMVTHVDHTEHDLDVIVTEQGLADVRGLCPRDRARHIIDRCAHPDFKDQLHDYVNYAEKRGHSLAAGHEPHLLESVFKMHLSLKENKTMKLDSWE
eukprot:GCRY01000587.1.p1 GENE.GCRY01000587.1~~GCRY01000587.1.p1  ORF type:complete len:538 (+),score=116.77 GCRY01000587.1:98-1711(+)